MECIICFEESTHFISFTCNHSVCHVCYPKLIKCPLCSAPPYIIPDIHPILIIYVIALLFTFIICYAIYYKNN